MSIFNNCNVILLKTSDLFSKIIKLDYGYLLLANPNQYLWGHKHLYITGPDVIKVNDWVYGESTLFKVKELNEISGICRDKNGIPFVTDDCLKIIATTDLEVLYDRHTRTQKGEYEQKSFEEGALSANFKKTDVLYLSESFIEYYIERYNAQEIIESISVEYTNYDKFKDIYLGYYKPMEDDEFNLKIKPFKKLWSRSEIYDILNKAGKASNYVNGDDFYINQKFIERFLDETY